MVEDIKIREAEDIDKIRKGRKDLEDAVSAIPEINKKYDNLMKELCVGPDCLKKKVEDTFGIIEDQIKKIEEKQSDIVCEKCGYVGIPSLASFCPKCGTGIYEWTDNDGQPIKGWKHWSERNK